MTTTPASTSRWQPLILAILGLAAPPVVWTASAHLTGDHWLRLVLAAASALAVLVAGFIAKVWEKLNSRWVDACANWVDRKTRLFFSSYRKRYLTYLGYKHRSFDVKGLSTQGAHSIEIEQVFVELSVDPRSPTSIKPDPITSSAKERHTIWDYLELSRAEGANLAVIGAPGCGKTTLLKHLALILAARRERRFRSFTPFLLFLRDHAKAIQEDAQVTLTSVIASALTAADLNPPEGWLENELDRGRGLILLDGLDEVADPDLRRQVVEWAERQMTRHGNDRFIVTSRPFGYRSNPLSGVTVLQVLSFTWPQVERFVSNWYLATETVAAGKKDPGVVLAAHDGAADLMRRLRGNPALSDLAVNPLLLTMIATVHRYRSTLPGRRVELYYEICEVFLGKRQQARGISLDFTPEQKKRVLEPLAWAMMIENKREIGREGAALAIAEALSRVTSSLSPEAFLRNVEESSGLLIERENGIYSFAHLTFQEYLAASHARERGLQDELTVHTHDTWWHETLSLFAAQSDATGIVAACLDNVRSATALALALECGEEARELRPDVRARLDQVLSDEVESPYVERRRIVAEALLARRLRSLVRLDDNRYIDDALITHAEYQLFLDELHGRREFRQPDHWTAYQYEAGSAKGPVVGVRPSDAEEFCQWLSARDAGVWTYRIPRAEEVERDQALVATFWVRSQVGPRCMNAPDTYEPARAMRPGLLFERFVGDGLDQVLDRALCGALELHRFAALELALDNKVINSRLASDLNIDLGLIGVSQRGYFFWVDRVLNLDFEGLVASTIVFGYSVGLETNEFLNSFAKALDRALEQVLDRDLDSDITRPGRRRKALDRACALALVLANYFSKHPYEHPYEPSLRSGSRFGRFLGGWRSQGFSYADFVLEAIHQPLTILKLRLHDDVPAFEGIRIMKSREP